MNKIIVVYNQKSGGGQALKDLKQLFLRHKLNVDHYITVKNAVSTQLKGNLNGGSLIIAAGGDGTVSAVASMVATTDATLAVLPTGTLNNFAKDVSVPLDLDEAIVNIKKRKISLIDVVSVNNIIFVTALPNLKLERIRFS